MNTRRSANAARLRHDFKAHLRAVQISERRVFVYCEGREHDPYMYSEITRRGQLSYEAIFQIYRIEEIAGTGGKPALMQLFRYLRRMKCLAATYKGKPYRCLFFADKDVDDMKHALIKSPHVLYTVLYDLEAHIYRDSDLRQAVAIGLSINVDMVPSIYDDAAGWIERTAARWEHWLTLCLFSARFNVDCGCNYNRVSLINKDLLSNTDLSDFEIFKVQLEKRSGMPKQEFDERFGSTQRTIRRLRSRRMLSRVFKGKWLEAIISAELQTAFRGQGVSAIRGTSISSAAKARFDFNSSWAAEHIRRVSNFMAQVH